MKQKSKSLILNDIMTKIDEQLASIPSFDFDGTPIEDSLNLDMHIDGIANVYFKDGIGRKHYIVDKTVATILVFDEIEERKNEPTKEDEYGNHTRTKE
tara:strand:- start:446 stop:739 length:294 start_codon:yes stop_codon:yes gene_type:complete